MSERKRKKFKEKRMSVMPRKNERSINHDIWIVKINNGRKRKMFVKKKYIYIVRIS